MIFPESVRDGDFVWLDVPDNPRLHGRKVKVKGLTHWGALVETGVGSGEYRALFSEMSAKPVHHANGKIAKPLGPEWTGDVCTTCGSMRMKRAGNCLCCDDCGSTSGCG